jgi:hypothetical protein
LAPQAPKTFAFGGGSTARLLHAVMLVALIIATHLLLFAPRQYAPIPFSLVVFLGSVAQGIYIGGFHFYVAGILIIVSMLWLLASKFTSANPLLASGVSVVDKFFMARAFFWAMGNIHLNAGVAGANAVVTQGFPHFSVIAGNPSKLVRVYNQETQTWIKPDAL